MTDREANLILAEKSAARCCEVPRDPDTIPEKGTFRPYRAFFRYRGSRNEVMFRFEQQSGDIRRLILSAVRPGYDMAVSHFLMRGTNQELLDYLSDRAHIPEWLDSFRQLSDSLDEKLD